MQSGERDYEKLEARIVTVRLCRAKKGRDVSHWPVCGEHQAETLALHKSLCYAGCYAWSCISQELCSPEMENASSARLILDSNIASALSPRALNAHLSAHAALRSPRPIPWVVDCGLWICCCGH